MYALSGFKIPSQEPPATLNSSKIWIFSGFIFASLIKNAAAANEAIPAPTIYADLFSIPSVGLEWTNAP